MSLWIRRATSARDSPPSPPSPPSVPRPHGAGSTCEASCTLKQTRRPRRAGGPTADSSEAPCIKCCACVGGGGNGFLGVGWCGMVWVDGVRGGL